MPRKIVRTKYGFYQYRPLPSEKTLEEYYAKKYYQDPQGTSYSVAYTKEEVKYFRLKTSLIFKQTMKLRKRSRVQTVLDVGCGEGWLLDRFYREGLKVSGIDYSSFSLKKFHPHLVKYFEQGDVNKILDQHVRSGKKFDLVVIANVIEHVLDPIELLKKIQCVLSLRGMLIIVAPNDFSPLQNHLLKSKIIRRPFWEAYPDHISYFNKNNMEKLLNILGWKVDVVVADNPVDLNLLNANSNYIEDRSKGKNVHMYRVQADNFLAGLSEDKLLELYTVLGSMGVGRDLTYYVSRKR